MGHLVQAGQRLRCPWPRVFGQVKPPVSTSVSLRKWGFLGPQDVGVRSSAQGCTQRTPLKAVVGFSFLESLMPRWPQLCPAPGLPSVQGGGAGQASPSPSEL